ncbi:hypothetical protein [Kineococcus sp. SYSU DK003]|uniref:hypothetical protein n=1 Tax=Kineococcus sp. SYSU DK003 TaxID=3383124 RepID=UPI003D7C909C
MDDITSAFAQAGKGAWVVARVLLRTCWQLLRLLVSVGTAVGALVSCVATG